jgi:hypothetical protein
MELRVICNIHEVDSSLTELALLVLDHRSLLTLRNSHFSASVTCLVCPGASSTVNSCSVLTSLFGIESVIAPEADSAIAKTDWNFMMLRRLLDAMSSHLWGLSKLLSM